jgi:glycosyltransferase involved in cell wall biosynthesis
MTGRRILFVADLGHTGPIWPQILDGVASRGYDITVISPQMSRAQTRFFGLNYSQQSWNWIQTNGFRSPYRKYAGYARFLRFALRKIQKHEDSNIKPSNDYLGEYSEWKDPTLRIIAKIHKIFPFDLIMSTNSPFATHLVACEFASSHNIPWIADYRDLWSLNHSLEKFDSKKISFEKELLKSAILCTTTSFGFSKDLSQLYNGKIVVIENGYDKLKIQKRTLSKSPIEILYPGQIYQGLQDIRPLIRALIKINGGERIKYSLKISGYAISHVQKILADMNQNNLPWIKFGKVLPLKKSLRNQQKSDLLLLLNCTEPNITGWMQTKLYEYISSGVPILALGGQGVDESSTLIIDSKSGFVVKSSEEIEDFLTKFCTERRSWLLRDDKLLIQLSRYNQGIKLAESLDELF